MTTMRTILLIAICLLVCSGVVSANVPSDYFYTFPVVVKSLGMGGTDWRSEFCIGNLSSKTLTAAIMYGSDDNDVKGGWVEIPRDETYCWQDLMEDGFGVSSFTGWLSVMAPEEDNYGMVLPFTASLRVYNWTKTGTYGVNVPPVNPAAGLFGLGQYVGGATGIQHYGSAGSSGFRTSVGLMSIETEDSQTVAIAATDWAGNFVWEKTLTLDPMEFKQISLPKSVTVYDGTLAVLSDGVITSYVTVVDNRSGDGVYRMPVKFDLDEMGYTKSTLERLVPPSLKRDGASFEESIEKFLKRTLLMRHSAGRLSPLLPR